ncbi:MAG: hypothetical protein IAE93_05845 [Ignavibacteria bacterium]|nr:hypothetical protein [Ignavibacteria bacterium]
MARNETTTQIYDDMLKTYDWFGELNIKDIESSRLPNILKYLKFYNEEFPKFEKGKPNILDTHINEAGTAINEAIALNLIREQFSKLNQHRLPIEELTKCIQGSFHSYDENPETSSNQARNTLFELETAAYLLMKGHNVTEEFEDVNVIIDNDKLSIQCKRPMSKAGIPANFNKAVSQLIKKNDIAYTENSFGMIAFSLEKIYNLDSGISNEPEETGESNKLNIIRYLENEQELRQMIDKDRTDMNIIIEPLWNATLREYPNIKLVGMLYLYRIAVAYKGKKGISFKREFIFTSPKHPETSPIKRITDYLERNKVVHEK